MFKVSGFLELDIQALCLCPDIRLCLFVLYQWIGRSVSFFYLILMMCVSCLSTVVDILEVNIAFLCGLVVLLILAALAASKSY